MCKLALLAPLSLAACLGPNPLYQPDDPLAAAADVVVAARPAPTPDAERADLGTSPQAPDLLAIAALPDLARAPDLAPAPDIAPPRPAPDLLQLADEAPAPDQGACGGFGQPCCPGNACAGGALRCLVGGEMCGEQTPTVCTVPNNCGGGGLTPCNAAGQPSQFGLCTEGWHVYRNKCVACLTP